MMEAQASVRVPTSYPPPTVLEAGTTANNISRFRRLLETFFRSFMSPRRPNTSAGDTRKAAQREPVPDPRPLDLPAQNNSRYRPQENEEACANMWSIYIEEAERYDKRLVESWLGDMDGILIFSGLYSASLTAFLVESYKNLQPDSGDAAVTLLAQISRQLTAASTGIPVMILPPEPFRPTLAALICNILWFLSLALSLTCSLLATMIKQWARDFVHKTEMRPAPIRRARILSFLYFGLRRFRMHAVVDLIPMLLHTSLFFFFAGLIGFLLPVNPILMYTITAILVVSLAIYIVLTILPLICLDSPYRTPLSRSLWPFWQKAIVMITSEGARDREAPSGSMTDAMETACFQRHRERDERAVRWTLTTLTDDTELLPLVESIPDCICGPNGFRYSNFHLFLPILHHRAHEQNVGSRIFALLLKSGSRLLDDASRRRRQNACLKAIWALAMVSHTPIGNHTSSSQLPPFFFKYDLHGYATGMLEILDADYASSANAALRCSGIIRVRTWMKYVESVVRDTNTPFNALRDISTKFYALNETYETLPSMPLDLEYDDIPVPLWINRYNEALATFESISRPQWIHNCKEALEENTLKGWTSAHVAILANYIAKGFRARSRPYQFALTSNTILKSIVMGTKLSNDEQQPIRYMFQAIFSITLPSQTRLSDLPMIQQLDDMMRTSMHLFAFITPYPTASNISGNILSDSMAGVYRYISTRGGDLIDTGILDDCEMGHLLKCIVADARNNVSDSDIERYQLAMEAIGDIFFYCHGVFKFDWGVLSYTRDEEIPQQHGPTMVDLCHSAMQVFNILWREVPPVSKPSYHRIMTILSWFVLYGLNSEYPCTDADSLRDHPLFHDGYSLWNSAVRSPLSPVEPWQIMGRVQDIHIAALAQCISVVPNESPRGWRQLLCLTTFETREAARHWPIFTISPAHQQSYAKAVLATISLYKAKPHDELLSECAAEIWSLTPDLRWIDDVDSASGIAEAWSLYRNMVIPTWKENEIYATFSPTILGSLEKKAST